MDNLARKEDLDREIAPFMRKVSLVSDASELKRMCHEFLMRFPPERGLEIASVLTYANPLFVVDIPAENAKQLSIGLDYFSEMVMRAKLTASRAGKLNVLVACAPKSASTFIQDAISKALGLPSAGLFTATYDAYSGSALGANLGEQEPDELALIRNGLNGRGYVAQHHARCSPYLGRLLSFYNIRPIVTHRNILDTLVSMDDMVLQWRAPAPDNNGHFFNDAMPNNYHTLDRSDRLTILAQRWTPWLTQFYVSWKKVETLGLVAPLWVSYEADFLGDKQVLAVKVAEYLSLNGAAVDRLQGAFEDKSDAGAKRLNKGVAGRGRDVPEKVRDLVNRIAGFYADDEDLSALLDA